MITTSPAEGRARGRFAPDVVIIYYASVASRIGKIVGETDVSRSQILHMPYGRTTRFVNRASFSNPICRNPIWAGLRSIDF